MEKYYLFGAGNIAYGVIAYFGKENIIAIIDNENKNKNSFMLGIPIISLEGYLQSHGEETIIITPAVYEDIEAQLLENKITNYYVAPMIQFGLASTEQMIAEWRLTEKNEIILFGYNPIGRQLVNSLLSHDVNSDVKIKVIPQNDREEKWATGDGLSMADETEINENTDIIVFQSEDFYKISQRKGTKERIYNIYDLKMESAKDASAALTRWKDIHDDEECFIVGNGPSLKIEDLEKIHNKRIHSFGMNLVYKIYDSTNWRPTYYIFSDYNMIRQYYDEIRKLRQDNLFIKNFYYMDETPQLKNANYYYGNAERYYLDKQKFSDDISQVIYMGYSVMFDALQIAIYMGYKRIYLVGADFSYFGDAAEKGNHFYDDKVDDKRFIAGKPHISITLGAMRKAEAYAKEHGIEIYNATRGGKLEVFRRKDLDSLI